LILEEEAGCKQLDLQGLIDNRLVFRTHLVRMPGRAWVDVIQIAQLILSNFGDNYFAQRSTYPSLGASSLSSPSSPTHTVARFCLFIFIYLFIYF
jgi:hypothetical protein